MKKLLFAAAAVICAFTMFSCSDKTAATEESADGYTKGTFEGNVYESEWADIRYTVPEGMNVLSEEDTYMLMGITKETIESEDENKLDPAKLDMVYELYGSSSDGSMVIINTFKSIDTAAKISEMKAEFDGKVNDLLKPSYGEETTVTYGGVEFTRLDVTASAPDFVMYQTYLFKDVEEHLFCVSVAAFSEEQLETLLEGVGMLN